MHGLLGTLTMLTLCCHIFKCHQFWPFLSLLGSDSLSLAVLSQKQSLSKQISEHRCPQRSMTPAAKSHKTGGCWGSTCTQHRLTTSSRLSTPLFPMSLPLSALCLLITSCFPQSGIIACCWTRGTMKVDHPVPRLSLLETTAC